MPDGDALPSLCELVVGPVDDLALHDGRAVGVQAGEEGEGVGPHQLPHQRQRQRLVPFLRRDA